MDFKSKPFILVAVVVAIVIVAAGFWYWSQKSPEVSEIPTETPAGAEVKDGLGAEVFKKSNNPLSNELPETNPFQVDTNPFK